MHVVARHGSLQTMRTLLEEGADPTWRSKVCNSTAKFNLNFKKCTQQSPKTWAKIQDLNFKGYILNKLYCLKELGYQSRIGTWTFSLF